MKKSLKKTIGLAVILLGACLFFYPFISVSVDDFRQGKESNDFCEEMKRHSSDHSMNDSQKNREMEKNLKDKIEGEDVAGKLMIPKLNQSFDVYEDADMEKISKGVAFLGESDSPFKGKGSRSIVAGHRGYYNKRMFKDIVELTKGDEIYILYYGKIAKYRVSDRETIGAREKEKLNAFPEREVLTLLTCNGMTDSSKRILINCDRVEEKCISSNTDIGRENKGGITQSNSRKKVCMAVAVFGTVIIGAVSFLLLGRVFRSHNQGLKI